MKEGRYFSNKNTGVTVCELVDCEFDAIKDVLKLIGWTSNVLYMPVESDAVVEEFTYVPTLPANIITRFSLPSVIKGKATCAESDKWNEMVGHDKAFDKAYNTYLRLKRNKMKEFADYLTVRSITIFNALNNYKRYQLK